MAQYIIKSKLNGLVLDVEGDGGPGAKVITWDRTGNDNQIWMEDPSSHMILSRNGAFALTMENDEMHILPSMPGNATQQFMRQGDVIRNLMHNKVLTVFGNEKRATVGVHDEDGGPNEKWEFEMVG